MALPMLIWALLFLQQYRRPLSIRQIAGSCILSEKLQQKWILPRIVYGWGFRFQFPVRTSFSTEVFSMTKF